MSSSPNESLSITMFLCVFVFSHFFKAPVTSQTLSSSSEKSKTFVACLILSFSTDELDDAILNVFYYGNFMVLCFLIRGGACAVTCPVCW